MLGVFFWDPSREIFSFPIPFLGRPLVWYGFFFALGFFCAYLLFSRQLRSYFLCHPFFMQQEILCDKTVEQYCIKEGLKTGKESLCTALNKRLKQGKALANRIRLEKDLKGAVAPLQNRSRTLAEKAFVYAILGVVIGARLGDVFFYQNYREWLEDPFLFFRVWEGGLSSHGGAIGVLIAFLLFFKKEKRGVPALSFFGFLDLVCMPTALLAGFIRIGNFFNQEILGVCTTLPWGVVFGHPAGGGALCPRHPVQIYESLFYFLTIPILWIYQRKKKDLVPGTTVGLFLMLIFGFRIAIEFLKEEQSVLVPREFFLTMGQCLSIPFFFFGAVLFFSKKSLRHFRVKGD